MMKSMLAKTIPSCNKPAGERRRAPDVPARSVLALAVLAATLFFTAFAGYAAAPASAQDVGEAWFPGRPEGYVNDYVGVLSAAQRQELEAISARTKEETGAELGVAIVPTTKPLDARLYAVKLFEKWGLGERDKDNGLLVLVALDDRRVEVEVGYGLEGLLPDQKVGRILDEHLVPHFKAGRYSDGLKAALEAFSREVAMGFGGAVGTGSAAGGSSKARGLAAPAFVLFALLPLLVVVAFVGVAWYMLRRAFSFSRRCPRCGGHAVISDRILAPLGPGSPGRAAKVLTCTSCGYREQRIYQTGTFGWIDEGEDAAEDDEGVTRGDRSSDSAELGSGEPGSRRKAKQKVRAGKPFVWMGPFGPFGGGFFGGGFGGSPGGGGFGGFGGGRSGGGGAGRSW